MDFFVLIPVTILAAQTIYNIRRADRAEAALARLEAAIRQCETDFHERVPIIADRNGRAQKPQERRS